MMVEDQTNPNEEGDDDFFIVADLVVDDVFIIIITLQIVSIKKRLLYLLMPLRTVASM